MMHFGIVFFLAFYLFKNDSLFDLINDNIPSHLLYSLLAFEVMAIFLKLVVMTIMSLFLSGTWCMDELVLSSKNAQDSDIEHCSNDEDCCSVGGKSNCGSHTSSNSSQSFHIIGCLELCAGLLEILSACT